jgi:hypothetical protein
MRTVHGTHNGISRIANVTTNSQQDESKQQSSDSKSARAPRTSSRLSYSLNRLSKMTDTSVKLLYLEIAADRLIARKVGRRTVVLRCDAVDWLNALPMLGTSQKS